MKLSIYLYLTVLICFVPFNIYGTEIDRIGIEAGLSSNYVVSVTQDNKGFLWFATESGLNKFDGNKFKVYKKKDQQSSPISISGNELNKVYADKYEDIVWIATQREGLNMFDCKTETFTHYRYNHKDQSGLVTNDITDVINSKDGNIWVSTYYAGIEYLNKKTKKFTHYNTTTINGMVSDNIWCVNEDNRGLLYIGHVSSGLSILSLKDKKIKNYKHNPNDAESLPGDEIRAIFIDKNDNVWIGTNNGLALFNPEKETFTVFKHDPRIKNSLSANFIFTITQLKNGQLWIGTEKGGVSILDIGQSMFLTPQNVSFKSMIYSDDHSGLSNPTVRSIYQDSFDNIWLGTYGGGINFVSHYPSFFKTWIYSPIPSLDNTLSDPVAWGICTDRTNRVWVGTDGGGIDIFDKGVKIKTLDKSNSPLTDNAIISATRDSDNNLWFGTFRGGVIVFDSQYKVISQFLIENKNVDIRCFYEDKDKNMLIGTSSGLYEYNILKKQGKLHSFEKLGLPSNLVRAISKDNAGRFWVGFFGEGLTILDKDLKDPKKYKTENGLPSNTIDYIYKDTKGQMWVATGEGIVLYKNPLDQDNFEVYNEQNGFKNTHVRAITEDDSNNIWISSNDGISRLICSTGKFYHYNHYNGVPLGDFMSASVAKDSEGQIFFGSQNGLCYFNPGSIPTHLRLPPTVITSFSAYNNQHQLTDTEMDIPVSSVINLNYNQNTFSLSFNVLDYALNKQVEYSYTLKGFEDRWYNTQGANIITFRNIPPGSYELLIKSRVKNQDWSDNISSLNICIYPPLWLTWWAKSLYLVLIIVIVFFILRFYKRKIDLETSLTIEKRNHTQELRLNDERLRFFTNITHELRTPLTLILGPLEDLQNEAGLSERHATKISVIHKSAIRLLNLINQILEFRKTETQNKKLTVHKGDLSQLIQEIGLKYKELNMNSKIEFNIIIEAQHSSIYFDPDIIGTILENLLSNAFKYTESGHISLILSNIKEDDINYTQIEVSDSGRGIPSEDIPRIFERYYQANGDKQVSGTGIGLALVQNLVLIHEGQITVDSTLGVGTSFRFRFNSDNIYTNAKHIDSSLSDIAKTESDKEEDIDFEKNTTENKPIILVVEDNKDIRDYIQNSLSEQYIVHIAINGIEGLERAQLYIPDIIISDIMMPKMDGLELSKRLKDDIRTCHIPIVLLTAKDSIQDRTDGYNLGVASYITKPFSASLLKSRIVNLLETRKDLAKLINKNRLDKKTIIIDALNTIDNEFIEKITSVIEQNLDSDKIEVAFIAEKMNMSHSTLYRKVKALCGISVNEFIRKIRISNAEKLLLTGKYSISEISYMVGINSITYFRQCFKDEFGLVPSEYIKKIKGKIDIDNSL